MKKSSLLIWLLMGILSLSCLVGYAAFINVTASDTSIEESEPTTAAKIVAFSTTTSSYYTRVSKAIGDTKSGGTCYILPFNYADDTPWGKEGLDASSAVLDEDATLVSGATLTLPMSLNISGSTISTNIWDGHMELGAKAGDYDVCSSLASKLEAQVGSDYSSAYIGTYLCCSLTIESSKTLTVYGTIQIGGVTGKEDQQVSGQTTGCYSQIMMDADSQIDVKSGGSITCYGYIKETLRENGSLVTIENGASLLTPLVFYDYWGGSATYAYYKSADEFPLEQWDMPNLQSKVRVNYGGTLNGYWDLWTDDVIFLGITYSARHWTGTATIFASSNALLNLNNSSSYAIMKYHPKRSDSSVATTEWCTNYNSSENKEWYYTSSSWAPSKYIGEDGNSYSASTTDIDIYGGANFGSLSVNLNITDLFSLDADSADYYLPISYRYQIGVHDGTTNASNAIKFLPGSSLHIYKDAALNQTANMIFYQSWPSAPSSSSTGSTSNCHPNLGSDSDGYDWSTAHCIVDGTWKVESCSLAGYINTSAESANLIFNGANASNNAVVTKECYNGNRDGLNFYYDSVNVGVVPSGPTLVGGNQADGYMARKTYTSSNEDGYAYWGDLVSSDNSFTVTSSASDSNSVYACTLTDMDGNALTTPIAAGTIVCATVTYTAKWSPLATKTLTVKANYNDGNGEISIGSASNRGSLTKNVTLTVSWNFALTANALITYSVA